MTNITTQPYNLTQLANQTSMADFAVTLNAISGNIISGALLFIVFTVTFYYADKRDYDAVSSTAYASYITFIIALLGRIVVINEIPLVPTQFAMFTFVLSAIMAFILFIRGR